MLLESIAADMRKVMLCEDVTQSSLDKRINT